MANFGQTLLEGIAKGMLLAEGRKQNEALKMRNADFETQSAIKQAEALMPIRTKQAQQIADVRASADLQVKAASLKAAQDKLNAALPVASPTMVDFLMKGEYEKAFAFGAGSANRGDKDLMKSIAELSKIAKGGEIRQDIADTQQQGREALLEKRIEGQIKVKGIPSAKATSPSASIPAQIKPLIEAGKYDDAQKLALEMGNIKLSNALKARIPKAPKEKTTKRDEAYWLKQQIDGVDMEIKTIQESGPDRVKDEAGNVVLTPEMQSALNRKNDLIKKYNQAVSGSPAATKPATTPESKKKFDDTLNGIMDILSKRKAK